MYQGRTGGGRPGEADGPIPKHFCAQLHISALLLHIGVFPVGSLIIITCHEPKTRLNKTLRIFILAFFEMFKEREGSHPSILTKA